MEIRRTFFNRNKHFYGILVLVLLMFLPASASARKKSRDHGRGMAAYVAVEPDALAPQAENGQYMKHVAAISLKTSNGEIVEGIDVSHYQGRINWDKVVDGTSITYAYLKATEGASLIDDTYRRNLTEAKRVGLSVGSYHFYRPNVNWKEQFQNLISVVKADEQDLVPIIDIEHRGYVSSHSFITNLKAFIEKVTEHYGKKPLLYTYHNFYNKYLMDEFKDYHFMIARYRPDSPVLNDGKDYIMWQYTATGSVPGINGNVDRSKIMEEFSLNQLAM